MNLYVLRVGSVFFESDNYHSFNRVINAWSFRRKSTGPDRGSYFHELFLRGKPHLQKYMRRLPRTHKKLAMAKSEEPDFFELAKTSPLPTLEQARMNLESRKFMRLREHLEKESAGQGGLSASNRSSLANTTSHETNALDPTKRQNMKHTEPWRDDQDILMGKKGAVDQFGLAINRGALGTPMKLPNSLFRLQRQDGLQQKQQQQQQQQQQQARAVQQQAAAVMMRQQQEQELVLARHHRVQMMQQMEAHHQQQYLQQQQQNEINLLRQMDFFTTQRGGF